MELDLHSFTVVTKISLKFIFYVNFGFQNSLTLSRKHHHFENRRLQVVRHLTDKSHLQCSLVTCFRKSGLLKWGTICSKVLCPQWRGLRQNHKMLSYSKANCNTHWEFTNFIKFYVYIGGKLGRHLIIDV